jgi:hypothetical protein
LAIRLAYLIAIPIATWFLLGWIWKVWHPHASTEDRFERTLGGATPGDGSARNTALKLMVILSLAILAVAYFVGPLYIELQISLYGEEAMAMVEKVETVERDDGDRAWTIDLINYTFRTKDGYIFAGVNDANSSQTEELIGPPDATGNYLNAKVQYVRSNPQWHRLKGWGYDGFGPPGSVIWIFLRMAIVVVPVAFAFWYVYDCLIRSLRERSKSAEQGAAPDGGRM